MHSLIEPAVLTNIECEQALLGAILVSKGTAFDSIDSLVIADDFFEPIHRTLFALFANLRKEGRAIDIKLASAAIGTAANDKLVGGLNVSQYFARLAAEATSTILAPDYANSIRGLADRRRLLNVADSIRDGLTSKLRPPEIAAFGIDQLDAIASSQPGERATHVSIGSAATQSLERMQWGMQNPGVLSGVSWGLSDLNTKTGGLQRGELVVVAGRPGIGKSGLAVSVVLQSAKVGNSALIFSLEMTAQALADRALADWCFDDGPLAYHDISRGQLTNADAERVVLAGREIGKLSVTVDERPALTVSQIATHARRHKQWLQRRGRTLDLVVVDHMHLVRASDRYSGNRVNEITEISGGLKALAKELNVPVIALAQLSRAVETRDDKRPMLSDLRDSGAIEQDADLILFVYREAYYLERSGADPAKEDLRIARLAEVRNRLEVIIAKQRNGPVGTVPLFFDVAANAVRNFGRSA